MKRIIGSALALCFVCPAISQTPIIVGAQPSNVIRAGTMIPMRTLTDITTEGKHLRVGQRFELETSEPVSLNGQVVIPTGTHGVAEITTVRNKGMWGKSGNIDARVLYLRVGDRQIRLSGTLNDKGVTGTGGVVASAVLVPVVGFFVTGTSAKIPPGSPVKAFLDEDVPVQFAGSAAPSPIIVPVAPQPSAPAAAPKVVQAAVAPK